MKMSRRQVLVGAGLLVGVGAVAVAWMSGRGISVGSLFAANSDVVLKNQNFELVMSSAHGGAITSLKFKGLEVVDTGDYGRFIQVAWQYGDHGECANPTEAGSITDGARGRSSSVLISAVKDDAMTGTTTTRPAWWIPPGGGSNFCNWKNGAWGPTPPYPALDPNGKLTANSTLTKRVSITGKRIEFLITPHMDAQEMQATGGDKYYLIEIPAILLKPVFTKLYRLRFSDNTLISKGVQGFRADPPILCNADESVCMGWYSPDVPEGRWPSNPHNKALGYNATDLRSQHGIWTGDIRVPATERERTFRSHMFFGTSTQVKKNMINHRYKTYKVGKPILPFDVDE